MKYIDYLYHKVINNLLSTMSLIKMFSGQKKECTVWQWFTYDEVHAKSICSASTADDKACGEKIAGKNATNMKVIKPAIITTPGCCPCCLK